MGALFTWWTANLWLVDAYGNLLAGQWMLCAISALLADVPIGLVVGDWWIFCEISGLLGDN